MDYEMEAEGRTVTGCSGQGRISLPFVNCLRNVLPIDG